MNKKQFIIISFSLSASATALYLIPTAAAQTIDTQAITDGFQNLLGSAQQFIADQPIASGALAATGTGTGIGAIGWKYASKAKNKLQSAYNGLTEKVNGLESSASQAQNQLTEYKAQAETQLSTLTNQAKQQTEQLQTKLSAAQNSVTDLTAQKASIQNQYDDLKKLYDKAAAQLEVLTPKVK